MRAGAEKPVAYRARWLLPGDRPPIHGGVLTIGSGKILAVAEEGGFDVDLGDVVLAAGFVNAHAHLDLSDAEPLQGTPSSFVSWLRGVVAHRRGRPPLGQEALTAVAEEMRRQGTAALGDVALGDVVRKAEAAGTLAGVTFGEVLGHREERYGPLSEELAPFAGKLVGGRRIGVSPHAPYSTAAAVFRSTLPGPRCTHWLESPGELEFLRTGGGPMKEFLEELGAWPASVSSGQWYKDPWVELLGDPAGWLLVHANFMTKADLEHALRLSGGRPLRIAYCPRTHAAFGFNEYPLEMFLDAGCVVGLGTDSLASNPDLNVFQEAVFVAERFSKVGGERLLRMLTLEGAKLLGCGWEYGSLTAGKSAAVAVMESPGLVSERFDWQRFFSRETRVLGWLGEGARGG